MGILTIALSGKDLDFSDRSERARIEDRIKRYGKLVHRMEKQAGAKSVEEYYSDNSSAVSRYQNFKKKLAREKARLKKLSGPGSFFEFKTVPLNKKIDEDMQVNGWTTKFADTCD